MEALNETIERKKVESSQIDTVAYDAELRRMELQFKTGSVYVYDNIGDDLVQQMLAAESVGKWFGQNIKPFTDLYPFWKIRGPFSAEEKAMRQDGSGKGAA